MDEPRRRRAERVLDRSPAPREASGERCPGRHAASCDGTRRETTPTRARARSSVYTTRGPARAAFQDPEVVVDRRKVARWTVARDVDSSVDVSFVVGNTVEDVVDVFFEITWRQSAVEGTSAEPERVAMRFDKTFGTVFIETLRGSIELTPVDDGTTRVSMIEHLQAAQGGIDNAVTFLRDLHGSVAARAAARPLPTYPD